MRFLVDENVGPVVARWLQDQGHQIFSVFEEARGWSDEQIIEKAVDEDWILITIDKDFGEKVFRENHRHKGIVLLRIADERSANKISVLARLLNEFSAKIDGQFVVVTESTVRFARIPGARE